MTRSRIVHVTREVLLTSSAIVGALCILVTALGFVLGVHPLMFKSGSMSPTIDTGDIAFARTVDAADVRRGDIVSLVTPEGERVTHRVVETSGSGAERKLTLKGDANEVIDPRAYDVTSVQKVAFHLPKLGYAVNWLGQAPGVYLVAAYVALMFGLIWRRRDDDTPADADGAPAEAEAVKPDFPYIPLPGPAPIAPRRNKRRFGALATGGVLAAAVVAVTSWSMPTWGAWTDDVVVNGQNLTTGVWGGITVIDITEGRNFDIGNNGSESWSRVCTTGRICADVVDTDGTATVRYVLEGTSGTRSGTCWNATSGTWVASPAVGCSILMTRVTGTATNGQWQGANIPRTGGNGVGTSGFKLTITATDTLSAVTTKVVNFSTGPS